MTTYEDFKQRQSAYRAWLLAHTSPSNEKMNIATPSGVGSAEKTRRVVAHEQLTGAPTIDSLRLDALSLADLDKKHVSLYHLEKLDPNSLFWSKARPMFDVVMSDEPSVRRDDEYKIKEIVNEAEAACASVLPCCEHALTLRAVKKAVAADSNLHKIAPHILKIHVDAIAALETFKHSLDAIESQLQKTMTAEQRRHVLAALQHDYYDAVAHVRDYYVRVGVQDAW